VGRRPGAELAHRRVIRSSRAFQAMPSEILLRQAVLFVGHALSDVNFRLL
jgi:hypothetical protein